MAKNGDSLELWCGGRDLLYLPCLLGSRTEGRMKQPDYERQILALGWDTESAGGSSNPDRYKATQGNFSTPWRSSWAEVLADVQKLKETAKEQP